MEQKNIKALQELNEREIEVVSALTSGDALRFESLMKPSFLKKKIDVDTVIFNPKNTVSKAKSLLMFAIESQCDEAIDYLLKNGATPLLGVQYQKESYTPVDFLLNQMPEQVKGPRKDALVFFKKTLTKLIKMDAIRGQKDKGIPNEHWSDWIKIAFNKKQGGIILSILSHRAGEIDPMKDPVKQTLILSIIDLATEVSLQMTEELIEPFVGRKALSASSQTISTKALGKVLLKVLASDKEIWKNDEEGQFRVIEKMIHCDADLSLKTDLGQNAIALAIMHIKNPVIQAKTFSMLVSKGVDINEKSSSMGKPIWEAIEKENVGAFFLLLSAGAEVTDVHDQDFGENIYLAAHKKRILAQWNGGAFKREDLVSGRFKEILQAIDDHYAGQLGDRLKWDQDLKEFEETVASKKTKEVTSDERAALELRNYTQQVFKDSKEKRDAFTKEAEQEKVQTMSSSSSSSELDPEALDQREIKELLDFMRPAASDAVTETDLIEAHEVSSTDKVRRRVM